ncbi:MAG: hypothetical protein LBP81_09955 [Treponema sp.]|nr:hypothetical protein [Treponema sp.]
MKRTLLSSTVVLAALTMFFAACNAPVNPSDITTTEVPASISGPEGLKATAYRGVNVITWTFNKDAKDFTVFRQRSDGQDEVVHLGSSTIDKYYYIDTVNLGNPLEDGVEYTYYVTANSGLATSGRSVIQDGAAKVSVTANIPARYANAWQDVTVLLETDQTLNAESIKVEKVTTTTSDENLLLSWPSYNPGFNYQVYYDIGKAITVNKTVFSSITPNNLAAADLFYKAPLFGGENTIRVVVKLGSDEYYYQPITITKALSAYSANVLPDITNYDATRIDATTAKITWETIAGAPKAADYRLYRIEILNENTAVGDWTPVSIGLSTRLDTSGSGARITVQDTGLTPSKSYLYALYAEAGGAKSATVTDNIESFDVPDVSSFDLEMSYKEESDTRRTYTVTIGWNKVEGHSGYTLEKAPVTTSLTNPSKTVIGDYTPISIPDTALQGNRYTVTDSPALWKSWKYRLTSKDADGVEAYSEKDLNSDPFRDRVYSGINVSSSSTTAYATNVSIWGLDYTTDIFVDIYRAEVPASISTSTDTGATTSAVENAGFVLVRKNFHLKGNASYTDEGLVIGTKYIYRHVVKASPEGIADTAREISNRWYTDNNYTGYVQLPSVPYVSYISNAGSNTTTTTTTYYFKLYGSIRLSTKIQLQKWSANSGWSKFADAVVSRAATTLPSGSSLSEGDYYV